MEDNQSELFSFRAEPRLARAIKEAAAVEAVTLSDYIRFVLRLHLFDYRGTHSMGEPRPTYESEPA